MLEGRLGRLTLSNPERQNFEGAQQTSAKQLNAPKREDLGVGLYDDNTKATKCAVIKYYYDLKKFPLTPSRYFDPNSQITVYSVGCPRIDGGGINALLYFAAPNKFFGFDTSDILNDWSELFNKDNKKRLNAHSRFPDWNITAAQIGTFREAISLWFTSQTELDLESTQGREGTFEPMIKWARYPTGKREWLLGQPADPNTLLGLYYAAAFSYDITSRWPQYLGYNEQSRKQSMGTTQTVHLAVLLRDTLFYGTFMEGLEKHTDETISTNKI